MFSRAHSHFYGFAHVKWQTFDEKISTFGDMRSNAIRLLHGALRNCIVQQNYLSPPTTFDSTNHSAETQQLECGVKSFFDSANKAGVARWRVSTGGRIHLLKQKSEPYDSDQTAIACSFMICSQNGITLFNLISLGVKPCAWTGSKILADAIPSSSNRSR